MTHTAIVLPGMWWKTVASPTTFHSSSYKQSHSCFVNKLFFFLFSFLIGRRQQGVMECRVLDESTSVLFSEGFFSAFSAYLGEFKATVISTNEIKGIGGSLSKTLSNFSWVREHAKQAKKHYEKSSSSHKCCIIFYKCFPWCGGLLQISVGLVFAFNSSYIYDIFFKSLKNFSRSK